MKNPIRILVVSLMVLGLSLTTGCNKKKSAKKGADQKAAPAADKKAAPAADKKAAAPTGDLAAKCGQATENILKIMTAEMTKRGAPKEVIEKIATDKAKISAKCVEQTKGQPNGAALLDCMIAAKDTNGMRECSVKHPAAPPKAPPAASRGEAVKVAPPTGAGATGPGKDAGDPAAKAAPAGAPVKAADIKKAVEAVKKAAAVKGAPVNADAIKKAAEAIKKAAPATK